jgi:hypothetical protein
VESPFPEVVSFFLWLKNSDYSVNRYLFELSNLCPGFEDPSEWWCNCESTTSSRG